MSCIVDILLENAGRVIIQEPFVRGKETPAVVRENLEETDMEHRKRICETIALRKAGKSMKCC